VIYWIDLNKGDKMKKFILTLAIWIGLTASAYATEMIMFSTKTCGYCRNFLREVAPTYNNSEYAKLLPLRIISMDQKNAPTWFSKAYDERRIDGISGTPTFIIFSNGNEVARLIGYRGKEDFYADIKDFVNNNRERLEKTAGQNPIPYEKEHELDPKTAGNELVNRSEGSHSQSVPRQQSPFVPFLAPDMGARDTNPHTKAEEKDENGVFLSNDIMDHQYKTPEEAIRAAVNKFDCEGIHSHMIKGKKIWMPCKMQ